MVQYLNLYLLVSALSSPPAPENNLFELMEVEAGWTSPVPRSGNHKGGALDTLSYWHGVVGRLTFAINYM